MVERIHLLVTPGAGDNYASSLGAAVKTIEGDIEPKIKQQQGEAQVKLDASFSSLSEASSAALSAKSAADTADKSWFECAAEEQSKRQTIEAASKSLASSRSNENEACQLQQDNKDFAFDASGKYNFEVACDFAVGDCASKMEAFVAETLKKIEADAKARLNAEQAKYTKLKASCDARTEERVAAQSALDAADSAWSSQRATCVKLSAQRKSAMCTFGSKVQGKCAAETQFSELVGATQKSDGTELSEIDRASEWKVSQTAKCLVSKAILNGLQTAVSAADTETCVSIIPTLSKLNLHNDEFLTLAASNKCTPLEISFFNGQAWNVPAGEAPASSEYTRGAFTPELDPSGNFDFCSAAPPTPSTSRAHARIQITAQ